MKRNFLLLLLLTLLPVAGWAQPKLVFMYEGSPVEELALTQEVREYTVVVWNSQAFNYHATSTTGLITRDYSFPQGAVTDRAWTLWYSATGDEGSYEEVVLDDDQPTQEGNASFTVTQKGFYKVTTEYVTRASYSLWDGWSITQRTTAATDPVLRVYERREAQVEPQNGAEMEYGGEIYLDPENAGNLITLTDISLNTVPGLKEAILPKLKVQNAEELKTKTPGVWKYSFALKNANDKIVSLGGIDYVIAPVRDGDVTIKKGHNELIPAVGSPSGYLFYAKTGIPFTGQPQDLVGTPENEETKLATLGGVEYFFLSYADYHKLLDTPDDPETEDVDEYEETEIQPEDFNPENADIEGWEATWSEVIPQGTPVSEYYIWARAAAGGNNFDGGEAVYVGTATIVKSEPAFAGEIKKVDATYYVKTTNGNWKGLYKEIKPEGIYTTKIGDKDNTTYEADATKEEVTYYVQPGTKTEDEENPYEWNGNGLVKLSEATTIGVGTWRIIAAFEGNDNLLPVAAAKSKVYTVFEVKKPEVIIETTSKFRTIAYGVEPAADAFNFKKTWIGYEGTLNQANVGYEWFKEGSDIATTFAYPVGTYSVYTTGEFSTPKNDFIISFKPVTVVVTPGDIIAKIEDQELVFGQTLPLNLKYNDGAFAPDQTAVIAEFEKEVWTSGFTATNKETGEEYDLYADIRTVGYRPFTRQVVTTTILPVGEYEVTASLNEPGDPAKIIVGKGTWTITQKDINNTDFNDPRVAGMGGSFRLNKTYNSEDIELGEEDLAGKFTYRAGLLSDTQEDYGYYYGALVLDEDFEITGYENNRHAGTATFTVRGIGNFKGEKELTFTIDKARLFVRPTLTGHNTWKIGSIEDGVYAIDWENINEQLRGNSTLTPPVPGFINDRNGKLDLSKANGFKDLAVKRTVGATVGTFRPGLIAYLPEDAEPADDYWFDFGTANLTIEKGLIVVRLADQETVYSGTDRPDGYDKELELVNGETLNPIVAENWQNVVDINFDKITLTDNLDSKKETVAKDTYRYPAGEYKLTAAFEGVNEIDGALFATNYNVQIALGGNESKLTVKPYEITLGAKNKEVEFAQFLDTDHNFSDTKKNEFIRSIELKKVKNVWVLNDGNIEGIEDRQPGDNPTDLVTKITVTGVNPGENAITLTVAENNNYTITAEEGVLVVYALPGIELNSVADETHINDYDQVVVDKWGDWTTIQKHNGMPVEFVKLNLLAPSMTPANEQFAGWKAGEWHAMVLPFDVTVRDIAYAFGYAIVNVVDPEATAATSKENDVRFKLMEITDVIEANTPFCVKTDEDFDYAKTLCFGKYDVDEDPIGTYPLIIKANANPAVYAGKDNFYFKGTYEPMTIDKEQPYLRFLGTINDKNKWYFIKNTSETKVTLQPYTGYVDLGLLTGAREINFIFEEEDGSTTAINAAEFVNGKSAEGLYNVNGVKVQNANQKGVYIQNGKKFVVK